MAALFEHDSIFGFLNILQRRDNRRLLQPGERPPYPIIIANPTVRDVLRNFNRADFGALILSNIVGIPVAFNGLRFMQGQLISLRRFTFNTVVVFVQLWGLFFGFMNSGYRLQGFVYNGLQWRRKEKRFNKYDFSSEFEKNTIWKNLRIRD